MTKEQIKVFEELLKDENFIGRDRLKFLLWCNTVKPKFNMGDCFKVSEPRHKVYGHPIRNFKGKVIKIYTNTLSQKEEWFYTLELSIEYNNEIHTTTVCKGESDLTSCERCNDNINIIEKSSDECKESMDA